MLAPLPIDLLDHAQSAARRAGACMTAVSRRAA
jgi:hypothetical protein